MAKRRDFFTDNIQRTGDEDFLRSHDAKKLRNDAKRIISDIAYGCIDFDKHGIYFSDPRLIDALIDVSYTKMVFSQIDYMAVDRMIKGDPSTSNYMSNELLANHKALSEAYSLYYEYFSYIKNIGYSGDSIHRLKELSVRVRQYHRALLDPVYSFAGAGGGTNPYASPAIEMMYNRPNDTKSVTIEPPVEDTTPYKLNINTVEHKPNNKEVYKWILP